MMRIAAVPALAVGLFVLACGENQAGGETPARQKTEALPCGGKTPPPGMRCVPAGEFIRGSKRLVRKLDSGRRLRDESPVMKIYVSAFFMDETEVTVAAYNECVKAGGCTYAKTNYGRRYLHPRQPKMGANWFQARAYCRFRGKRLPAEAEWEKAARGPRGDLYPWGNSPADCRKAVIRDRRRGKGCGRGTTWPVASRPASRYGLYDMAGNAHEWVNDWYSKSYRACGADCAGRDPKGPCGGRDRCPGHRFKIVKGGSWWWPGKIALASHRRPHYPANRPYHHFGFRCAKSL